MVSPLFLIALPVYAEKQCDRVCRYAKGVARMQRSDVTPVVYRITEVADMLRLHRASVYRLVRNGSLRAVKVGASLRIPAREIERLLEQADGDEC